MEVLDILPMAMKIAGNLARRHHHNIDDLQGQSQLILILAYNKALQEGVPDDDLPKYIGVRIKFGLIQWMSLDKVIPMDYRTRRASGGKFDVGQFPDDAVPTTDTTLYSDAIEALKRLPKNEKERVFIEMKLEGSSDMDVANKLHLAEKTIYNLKSNLKRRYLYG